MWGLDFSVGQIIISTSWWIETTTCTSSSSKVSSLVLSKLCTCVSAKWSLLCQYLIMHVLINVWSLSHIIGVLLLCLINWALWIVKIVMRWSLLKFFLISFASIHILKIFLISLLLNKLTSSSLIILNLEILLRFLLQKLIVWIYLVINKSSWISWWKKLNHWTLVKAKTSLFYLLAVNQWVNSYILMISNLLILKAILIILRHFIKKIVLCAID